MKWLIGTACAVAIASGGVFLADNASAWMRSHDDADKNAQDRHNCNQLVFEADRRQVGRASTEMSDALLKLKLRGCQDRFSDMSDQISQLL